MITYPNPIADDVSYLSRQNCSHCIELHRTCRQWQPYKCILYGLDCTRLWCMCWGEVDACLCVCVCVWGLSVSSHDFIMCVHIQRFSVSFRYVFCAINDSNKRKLPLSLLLICYIHRYSWGSSFILFSAILLLAFSHPCDKFVLINHSQVGKRIIERCQWSKRIWVQSAATQTQQNATKGEQFA